MCCVIKWDMFGTIENEFTRTRARNFSSAFQQWQGWI